MVPMLSVYRAALIGYPLNTADVLWSALWAGGIAVAAVGAFVRYEGRMARYL